MINLQKKKARKNLLFFESDRRDSPSRRASTDALTSLRSSPAGSRGNPRAASQTICTHNKKAGAICSCFLVKRQTGLEVFRGPKNPIKSRGIARCLRFVYQLSTKSIDKTMFHDEAIHPFLSFNPNAKPVNMTIMTDMTVFY